MRRTVAIVAFTLASIAIFLYSLRPGAQFGWTEAIGFITGLWCVWLTILENVWNFPIGIANCGFLGVLFLQGRLFADAGLQLMFIALSVQGWWLWLYGGAKARREHVGETLEVNPPVHYPRPDEETDLPATRGTELHVSRADFRDVWQSLLLTGIGLPFFTWRLTHIKDAAPFWDAAITVFSIVAQILLNRKRLENWWVWLGVDVVSVWLYVVKHFYLTAALYAIYCAMAVWGFAAWQKELARQEGVPA